MAVVKSIIKNSDTETHVKVAGVDGSATIDLSTDLVHASQVVDGDTQTVNILSVVWAGESTSKINIERNSVRVITLAGGATASGMLYFDGQTMAAENTENTSDIVVTMETGTGHGELWIRLRKAGGYTSKIEYYKYGSYDDESIVGASTTLNGSPDYEAV